MKCTRRAINRGFSIIEILVVVAVAGMLASVCLYSFSKYRNSQTLKNAEDNVASLLDNARAETFSSDSSSQYGVHLQSSQAVFFIGATYNSSASTNKVVAIDPSVTITGITLTGGGSDVIFNRLTGETADYGTITFTLASDSTKTKVITISQTGLISEN